MQIFSTLGIDWQMLVAQLINFAILLTVLTFLVYKPILAVIDKRRERIQKSLDDAKKLEQRLEQMEKERGERMKEIDKEAKTLLESARSQAEKTKEKLLQEAQDDAAQLVEKGHKQLETDRRKMLADIQGTVSAVSIELAQRILQREFSDKDQARILQDVQKDLPSLIR